VNRKGTALWPSAKEPDMSNEALFAEMVKGPLDGKLLEVNGSPRDEMFWGRRQGVLVRYVLRDPEPEQSKFYYDFDCYVFEG
jgi:hypothetical protein